jgi:hypothetical protein
MKAKSNSVMSEFLENELVQTLAPVAGAAGATIAITVATERFGLDRDLVTLGGAAFAFFAASNTNGLTRDVLIGAATAGAALGVAEILKTLRPKWAFGEQPEPAPEPAKPEGITRADLDKAIDEVRTKYEAQIAEREKAHEAQMRELQSMVRTLALQLRHANETIEQLQNGQRPKRQATTREQRAHLDAIGEQLTPEELEAATRIESETPPPVRRQVEETLCSMPVDEAVAFVRKNVLREANGSHPPQVGG